ncbi:hypothetical protein [Paludisphaera rhizosphaerae]|uniref:hypothetical protein n=1 Tax=Paludisphaera rhizosphaerae TaxID=2711216 RepID=UPI0013EDFB7D|nr:hypothetical protein [Paludisphaera rhizosphaerae]
MNPDRRVVVLVMCGIAVGALTASLVPWSPLPRALLVGVVAAFVAASIGWLLHPKAGA